MYICRAERDENDRDTLIVAPRTEPLPALRLAGEAPGYGEGRQRSPALAGEDDVIPRGYRHGDDLRRVHWRSTARYGELMVRREEQPQRARCTVLLDTRRTAYPGSGPGSAFEWAVSGAASVLASVLSVCIALSWSISAAFYAGCAAYIVAALAFRRASRAVY